MGKTRFFVLITALWLSYSAVMCGQSSAQMPADPSNANDVTGRMSQLETETQSLRAEVQWLRDHQARQSGTDATLIAGPSVPPQPPEAGQANPPAYYDIQSELKKHEFRKGDFAIVPYGWLWGNAVNNTERTNPGSYTLYALSASTTPEDEFIVDARNTRLGFDVAGPQIPFFGCARTGGKVEIDFQQSVLSTENKATVLLRHAYAEVVDEDFRLLAGQTWDVISPLYPGMLMYSVGWDGGNIGYRRAQFRGERYYHLSDVSLVTVQASIDQNVFPDYQNGFPGSANLHGETSNWPILEGRLAWTIGPRGPGCLPITVGTSAHIGNEEFDIIGGRQDNYRRTWSANMDIRIPITNRLGFQAECYTGENLSAFFGGIGQGIDPTDFNGIRDSGGWFEVWYDWAPRLHSHVGYSVDQPNGHDLHTVGERSYNQFYFGNISYDVTKNFLVGLEVSSWRTTYVGQLPGDSVRTEFVAKYGF
jgi:hypothetical protein